MRYIIWILLLTIGLISTEISLASDASIQLEGLIEEALEGNPEVLSAKARHEAAKAEISQSWALEKPWVSYDVMIENLETRIGPQDRRISLSQKIPFPAKLPLRARVAKAVAMRVGHEVFHVQQSIRSHVVIAYANLLATQQILSVLENERITLEQIAEVIQAQYIDSKSGASDPAKIEVELAKLTERILKTTSQRVADEERLNILLSRQENSVWPMLAVPTLPELQFELETLKELTLKYRHGLIIKKILLKEQKTKHQLAKMEYLPDIEIGFKYIQVGSGTTLRGNDGQDAWMIPIKFSLPLWEPQIRGKVREERKLKEAAEQDVRQATNRAMSDIIQRQTQYRTARDRVAVYDKTWIPQAEQVLANVLGAYRAGNTSVLDVLDSVRMVLEAKIGYWQSFADTLTAYAEMEQTVGIPFNEVTSQAQSANFKAMHSKEMGG